MVETGMPCTGSPAFQQDAVVAVGVLPPDHGGEVGESPVVIVARRQARVQIVGMENGKRPGFRSPATSRAAATAPAGNRV